jgi:hypothetical protein
MHEGARKLLLGEQVLMKTTDMTKKITVREDNCGYLASGDGAGGR